MEIFNKTLTQAEQHKTRVSLGIILLPPSPPLPPTSSVQVRPCSWTAKHGVSCADLPGIADLQHQLQLPQAGLQSSWQLQALAGVGAQLVWMDIPRCSYYRAVVLNGHVLPEPTDRKVGVFSQQHLQLEVFVVQKVKPKSSSISGRRHRCGAVLHGQQWLHWTTGNNFCRSWWHEGLWWALKHNWYRQSTQAITDVLWTLE